MARGDRRRQVCVERAGVDEHLSVVVHHVGMDAQVVLVGEITQCAVCHRTGACLQRRTILDQATEIASDTASGVVVVLVTVGRGRVPRLNGRSKARQRHRAAAQSERHAGNALGDCEAWAREHRRRHAERCTQAYVAMCIGFAGRHQHGIEMPAAVTNRLCGLRQRDRHVADAIAQQRPRQRAAHIQRTMLDEGCPCKHRLDVEIAEHKIKEFDIFDATVRECSPAGHSACLMPSRRKCAFPRAADGSRRLA